MTAAFRHALVLALLVGTTSSVFGQDAERITSSLQFMKFYVEHGLINETDSLPYPKEEFDGLRKRILATHGDSTERRGAHIRTATFSAKLDGERLIEGLASIEIVRTDDVDVLLPLTPCGVAARQFRWQDGGPPPHVGIDANGVLMVLADRAGVLQFDWTLRGKTDIDGTQSFDLDLPSAPASTFQLTAPDDRTPVLRQGIAADVTPEEAANGTREWRLQLPRGRNLLEITPLEARGARRNVLAQQSTLYRVDRAGVEVVTRLVLDVHHAPLERLEVDFPTTLRLVRARLGDTEVDVDRAGPSRLTLQFPRPLRGVGNEVSVTGFASHPPRRAIQLPTVSAVGATVSRATMTLQVPDSVQLTRLDTNGCELVRSTRISTPYSGESHDFQCHSADASLRTSLQPPERQSRVELGSSLRLSERRVTARIVADISAGSDPFTVSFRRKSLWTVSEVVTDPPDALLEVVTTGTRDLRRELRLRDAIPANGKLRVVVRAHRNLPASQGLPLSGLRPLEFLNAAVADHVVSLHANTNSQLYLDRTGDLERLDRASLSADQLDRVESAGGILYRDSPEASNVAVALRQESPEYVAHADVECMVEGQTVQRHYRIRCQPRDAGVSRVVVHWNVPDISAAQPWGLIGPDGTRIRTRSTSGSIPNGTAQEIILPRPQTEPFELHSTVVVPLPSPTEIPLLSMPLATAQSATVQIGTRDGTPVAIQTQNLRGVTGAQQDPTQVTRTRAVLRYDPAQGGRLTLGVGENEQVTLTHCWSAELVSRYDRDGEASHEVVYLIENTGARRLQFTPASNSEIKRVSLNEVEVAWSGDPIVAIPLPADERFVTLRITYAVSGEPLPFFGRVAGPWPQIDVPVLERTWNVWVPRDFELRDATQSSADDPVAWDARLFGYNLVRRNGGPFNLFAREDWSRLIRPETWAAPPIHDASPTSEQASLPWQTSESALTTDARAFGWRNVRLAVGSDQETVLVYDHRSLRGLGWAACFCLVGSGVLIGRRWPTVLYGLVIILLVVALVAPTMFVPLARASFLGAVVAVVLCWLPARRQRGTVTGHDTRQLDFSGGLSVAGRMLVLAMVATMSVTSVAQEEPPVPPKPEVFPLYIPLGEDGEPTGDHYYLSVRFLQALRRLERSAAPSGWLIKSARYQATLSGGTAPNVTRLSADFDLHALDNASRLTIPFDRDEVRVLSGSVDGSSVETRWNEAGDRIEIDLPGSQARRLRLELLPLATPQDLIRPRVLDVSIPAVPDSRMMVSAPAGAQLELPTAWGQIDASEGQLQVELGATPRLALESRPVSPDSDAAVEFAAARMLWIHVGPRTTRVDTKIDVTVQSGVLRTVELGVSNSLQLLEPDTSQLELYEVLEDDSGQRIRLVLDRPYPAGTSLTLTPSFVIDNGGSTVVAGPRLEVVGALRSQATVAISSDPSVEVELTPNADWQSITPSDVAANWPNSRPEPQLAHRLPLAPSAWALSWHAVLPSASLVQDTELTITSDAVEVAYRGEVTVAAGGLWQLKLSIPRDLEILDLTAVWNEADDVLRRWAIDAEGTLTLFFEQAVTDGLAVTLHGKLAVENDLSFVGMQPRGATLASNLITVRRKTNVMVEVAESTGFVEVVSPDEVADAGQFRTVVILRELTVGDSAPLSLSVATAEGSVGGRLITTLANEGSQWNVEADLLIESLEGRADTLRFELPPEFAGPLALEPSIPFSLRDQPNEAGQLLTLWPRQPLAVGDRIRILGTLRTSEAGAVEVPRVAVLDVERLQQYFVLPRRVEDRVLRWETPGMREVDLAGLGREEPDGSRTGFQAVVEQHRAVAKRGEFPRGTSQVHLADIRLSWLDEGQCRGVATFDVEPAGRRSVELVTPRELEVVHITVAGLPAIQRQIEPDRTLIQLNSEHLPQRVSVLFQGALPITSFSKGTLFASPTIVDLPIAKTLWTVHPPSDDLIATPLLPHTETTVDGLRQARRDAIATLLASMERGIPSHSAEELTDWRTLWETRRDSQGTTWDLVQVWSRITPGRGTATRLAVEGSPVSGAVLTTSLHYDRVTADGWLKRCLAAAGVVAIIMGLVGIMRFQLVRDVLIQSPYLPGVVVGLLWWLFCSPSFLGWVIILVAVIGVANPGRTRRPPQPA